jgi:putative phosphoribosyl transferase
MKAMVRGEQVGVGPLELPGELCLPAGAAGLVMFVHGSGSSRLSPRNRQVAAVLHEHGMGTLLFDLLTEAEAAERRNVFDIALLAGRVGQVLDWAAQQQQTGRLRVGPWWLPPSARSRWPRWSRAVAVPIWRTGFSNA